MNFTLDKNSELPLYVQIREKIRNEIEEDNLKMGDKLPTVTAFSKSLGVTQTTIRRAYEDLIKEGILGSHVGRGTFVTNPEKMESKPNLSSGSFNHDSREILDRDFLLAARRLRMGIAKNLEDLMVLAQRPGLISFTSGVPDPVTFEDGILEKMATEAFARTDRRYENYADITGLPELREEIARRYSNRIQKIHPDQVLITSGSQQAVSVLAQAALELKQRVICETPCYMGIPRAFGALGHWVESIPRDSEGPITDRFLRFSDDRPTLFYTCPEMHNPMGTDISEDRQNIIIDWAKNYNGTVIADKIFHDIRFDQSKPVDILDRLEFDRKIIVGSLSKSFMCGLRVGWMIASKEKIRSIVALKRAMDISCPPLMQGIAYQLLSSGTYDKHLKKVRSYYSERCDVVTKYLNQYMPGEISWTKPTGGFHTWLELPKGYSSIVLFLLAIERGVAIQPGPTMDVDHGFVNGMRLSYGCSTLKEIQEGIELLADAVHELLKEPPKEPGLGCVGDFL